MRPPYLTGHLAYLRPLLAADAERAVAWFGGPFPINATRAERVLKEAHTDPWGPGQLQLAVVRLSDEEIVGGVIVSGLHGRTAEVAIHIAAAVADDEAEALRADLVRLTIPWLRDECELMTVTLHLPADLAKTIAAAEAVGMIQGACLRQHIARPGGRVDLLVYQALNKGWVVADAEGNHA